MCSAILLAAAVAVSAVPAEPTGKEWEDNSCVSLGKEPARAWFAGFPDVESAKKVLSSCSSRVISLDSEDDWRFKWSRRPSERPQGFAKPDYDVSGWDIIKVPCSWQAMGCRKSGERFGTPIYINQPYIFTSEFPATTNCWPKVTGLAVAGDWTFSSLDNPVGCYRRDFEVPEAWMDGRVTLVFDGVESFFYLWVNGKYVGFSKDARSPAEFDVTRYVKAGRNTVAVEVYRNSDASYLEAQDIFRLAGIFRPVSLRYTPRTYIRDVDFKVGPVAEGVYDGDWKLDLEVDVCGADKRRVAVDVFDAEGRRVRYDGAPGERARLVFARPKLWSAELPNLYTMVVSLEDELGRVTEAAGFQLGFREATIRDAFDQRERTFVFNGQPIKLNGVNRGETDPMYGHYVPRERLEQDIRLIKQGNFNHIRNSHFPQGEEYYYLCNRYGIYVMEEANIESHGSQYGIHSPSNCDRWRLSHLDRIASMYERSKNFPCVVIWSMGNEAGPGDVFRHCYNYIKERDKVRPVQYERNNWITDMGSRQYPSVEWVWSCARGDAQLPDNVLGKVGLKTRYPYHINEYAHNYNNNCGNLKDYQDAIESSDRIMGGALWDWADQSLWHRLADGRIVGGWGGTWGEKPEEGQGIMDGIVTTDRRAEPGYYEAKHVFQSFSASLVKARNIGRAISLKNKNYFRDSSHCRIVYKVLSDGEIVDEGEWTHFTIPPRGIEFVELPPSAKGDRQGMAVRVEFRLRKAEGFWPAGWVLASDQLELGDFVPPAKRSLGSGAEVVEDSESVIAVKSGDRVFSFSKSTGELVSLKQGSLFPEELLLSPMTLDVFRMPVGGETFYREGRMYFGRQKALEGLREMVPSLRSISRPVVSAGGELVLAVRTGYRGRCKEDFPRYGHEFMTEIKQLGALDKDAPGYEVETVWRFGADGKANMHSVFTQTGRKSEVSRVGWRLVLKESSSAVEYYARGPYDNYCDRKSASFIACWRSRTDKFGGEFGSSQDTGNREEARWVSLEDVGLKFSAVSAPFSFAISPYSPTELIRCPHFELLGSPAKTELGLYAKVRGLGSNNCGPPPLMKDRILAGETLKLELDWE